MSRPASRNLSARTITKRCGTGPVDCGQAGFAARKSKEHITDRPRDFGSASETPVEVRGGKAQPGDPLLRHEARKATRHLRQHGSSRFCRVNDWKPERLCDVEGVRDHVGHWRNRPDSRRRHRLGRQRPVELEQLSRVAVTVLAGECVGSTIEARQTEHADQKFPSRKIEDRNEVAEDVTYSPALAQRRCVPLLSGEDIELIRQRQSVRGDRVEHVVGVHGQQCKGTACAVVRLDRDGADPRRKRSRVGQGAHSGGYGAAVLAVDDLGKDYGDFVALDGVSIEVAPGSLVALVGANGAGKSTLLRCCSGLLVPTSGTVTIGGVEPGSVAARAATSFLPDEPVLYDDLSVFEHLEYVARLHGVDEWQPRAHELVERLGIDHRTEDLPSRFSRGLRQKTAIAVAFVRPFDLLLVDEPFVGLDAPGKAALIELLVEAADGGAAILVSTHELPFVEVAQRCVALRDGSVVADRPMTTGEVTEMVS